MPTIQLGQVPLCLQESQVWKLLRNPARQTKEGELFGKEKPVHILGSLANLPTHRHHLQTLELSSLRTASRTSTYRGIV
jgi:hypothetical protein